MSKKPKPQTDGNGDDEAESSAAASAQETLEQLETDREIQTALDIEQLVGSEDMSDGQVAVKRQHPANPTLYSHLERFAVSTLKPDAYEFVARRYGGGKFKLIFYVPTGDGNWRHYKAKTIDIDPSHPPGEFFREKKIEEKEDTSALKMLLADKLRPEDDHKEDKLLVFLKMSQDQSQLFLKMMMDGQAAMITAMSNMVGALRPANVAAAPNPGIDLLNALQVFNQLKPREQDPIRLLEYCQKLAEKFQERGDDEPNWLKDLLSALVPLMQRQMGPMGPMQPQEKILQPAETPGGPPPPPPPQPDQAEVNQAMNPPLKILVRAALPKLLNKIRAGATPDDAVGFLNMMLTDAQYAELVEILKRPTWPEDLFGSHKAIEEFRQWFEELRTLLTAEPEPESGE